MPAWLSRQEELSSKTSILLNYPITECLLSGETDTMYCKSIIAQLIGSEALQQKLQTEEGDTLLNIVREIRDKSTFDSFCFRLMAFVRDSIEKKYRESQLLREELYTY